MAEDIKVSAEVDYYEVTEGELIKGTLQVIHPNSVQIDPKGFKINGKLLPVAFVKDVDIGDTLIISIYSFDLPTVSKGLQILPSITILIGGKEYASIPSTYSVAEKRGSNPTAVPTSASPSVQESYGKGKTAIPTSFLKLDASVEATQPIYPGQRLKLLYRYIYEGELELTKEVLPLLQADGFLKIGQKEINDTVEGDKSVREISQIVQAIQPGTFSLGPSTIEGKAYTEDSLGRRQYLSTIQSVAKTIQIKVEPFPIEGKPISFNGAVGDFTFSVHMTTPVSVRVGDKVALFLEVKGNEQDLNSVKAPEMCCQPGFSGLFKLSDLPPVGQIKGSSKEFALEIRPLSDLIQSIPSIEFSFFDPEKRDYVKLRSDPIPIHVLPEQEREKGEKKTEQPLVISKNETENLSVPKPIEIQGNDSLTLSDLRDLMFSDLWTFLLIPFGIGIIYFQIQLKKSIFLSESIIKPKTSQKLFTEAMEQYSDSPQFYNLLNQSLMLRLVELGCCQSKETPLKDLARDGTSGKVCDFLSRVEELRFAGREQIDQKKIANEAKTLFKELEHS